MIDETTVDKHLSDFDAQPVEEQQRRLAELNEWKTAKQQEEQESRFSQGYTDFDTMGGLWAQMDDGKPWDDDSKAAVLNRQYVAAQLGKSAEDIQYTYPTWRDQYAADVFKKDKVTDRQFFDLVKETYDGKKLRTQQHQELANAVLIASLNDALAGKETSPAKIFAEWRNNLPAEYSNGLKDGETLKAVFGTAEQMRADMQAVREPAARIWDSLTKFTTGAASDEDVLKIGREISAIAPADRQKAYQYAAMAAQASGVDRGALEQVAKNIGESISRSFDFVPKGALTVQEDAVLEAIGTLNTGDVWIRGDEAKLSNIFKPSQASGPVLNVNLTGRRATPEEIATMKAQAEEILPMYQVARELKAVAREQIDPIKPIGAEGTLGGTIERGMYGLAGSTGYMLATAVNPMIGAAAYTADEQDRLRVENPDLSPGAARAFATISGSAQAALDRFQLSALAGRMPGLGGFLRDMQPGMKRWATSMGLNLAGENVAEGVQDFVPLLVDQIGAAVNSDMEGKDFREQLGQWADQRAETFFAVLPLALVGGGIANFRDFKDGGKYVLSPPLLEAGGFSDEQKARIASAQSPEEAEAIYQEEYAKRTPENVAKGLETLEQMQGDAQAAQADPNEPTLETRTLPDGSREFVVTDADGNEILTTFDEDAASLALYDESRRSQERKLVAEEEAAQSDEGQLAAAKDSAFDNLLGNELNAENLLKFSDALDLDPATADRLRALEEGLRKEARAAGENSGSEKVARQRASANDNETAELGGSALEFITGFENLTGKKVEFVDTPNAKDTPFAAVVNKSNPNTIYLHSKGDRNLVALIGHEWGHTLSQQDPGLYRDLKKQLAPLVDNWRKRANELKDDYRSAVRSEELTNNIIGDSFTRPEFWAKLSEENKPLFEKVLTAIKRWFEAMLNKAKGSSWGTESFISDLEAVHAAIMRTLETAAKRGPYSELPGANDADLSFARPAKPVDRTADMAAAVEKMNKNPDERVRVYQRLQDKFLMLVEENRQAIDDIQAAPIRANDGEASLDVLEQERAQRLADLDIDEQTEIEKMSSDNLDNFGERMENAKTDAAKKAIEREARIRSVERRRAIDAKYAERRKALDAEIKTQKMQVKARAAEAAGRESAKKFDTISRQKLIRSIGELDAMLSVLPPEVRGKVGGFAVLSKIGTGEVALRDFFVKRLMMMDEALEKHLVAEYSERIIDVLDKSRPKAGESGVKRSTLGPDAQAYADKVLKATYLNEDETALRMAAIDAAISSGSTDPALIEEWGILNTFGDLYNRNAETLAEGLRTLKATLKDGREQQRIIQENRLQETRANQADIVDALGKPDTVKNFNEANKSEIAQQKETGVEFLSDHLSFEQFLSRILPNTKALTSSFSTRMRKADTAMQDAEIADRVAMLETIKAAAKAKGVSPGQAIKDLKTVRPDAVPVLINRMVTTERIEIKLAEKIVRGAADPGKLKASDIKTLRDELAALPKDTKKQYVEIRRVVYAGDDANVSMTTDQAIQLLLSWRQRDVQDKMRRGGWLDSSIAEMRAMVAADPVATAVYDYLTDYYSKSAGKMAPVYTRMFNMKLPQVRDYAPTRFKHTGDTKEIGPDGMPISSAATPGFLKSRTSHSAPIAAAGATEVYSEHSSHQAHWINFAELARDFKSTFANGEVRIAIENAYGLSILSQLDNWTKQIETKGGDRARDSAWMNKWIGSIVSGQAVASLGFNPKTVAMQFDSALRFVLALSPKQIATALSNPSALVESMPKIWYSPSVQRRVLGGMSPVQQFLFRRSAAKPGIGSTIAEASMKPINYADAVLTTLSSAMVYRANFEEARAAGMSEKLASDSALDAVDAAIYRFSQPTGFGSKSLIENRGGIYTRMFMMFMSDPRMKTSLMIEAGRGIASGKDVGKHIKTLITIEASAMFSQVIANLYRDAVTDDEDEDIWSTGNFAKAAALAPFQGFLLLGSVADATLSKLTGEGFFAPSRNPILDVVNRGMRVMGNLEDTFNPDDPEAMLKQWNNMARVMAVTPGAAAPAAALNLIKPIVGAIGNVENED